MFCKKLCCDITIRLVTINFQNCIHYSFTPCRNGTWPLDLIKFRHGVDLRLSRRWRCPWSFSGFLRLVDLKVGTIVSGEHTASIFRVEVLELEAICSSEPLISNYRSTRRHSPEDHHDHQQIYIYLSAASLMHVLLIDCGSNRLCICSYNNHENFGVSSEVHFCCRIFRVQHHIKMVNIINEDCCLQGCSTV
jgi:hypothetical protein